MGSGPSRAGTAEAGSTVCCAGLCSLQAGHATNFVLRENTPTLPPSSATSASHACSYMQPTAGQGSPAAQLGHQFGVRYAR